MLVLKVMLIIIILVLNVEIIADIAILFIPTPALSATLVNI